MRGMLVRTVERVSPKRNSRESPGRKDPRMVAVSAKIKTATPRTANAPRVSIIP
jgi:hypothetical protein